MINMPLLSQSLYSELYLRLAETHNLTKLDYAIFLLNRVSPILASVNSKHWLDIERDIREILSTSPNSEGAKIIESRGMEFDTEEADPPERCTIADYESLVGSAQDIIGDGEVFSADEKEVADHFNNGTDDNTTFAKFAAVLALKAAAKS